MTPMRSQPCRHVSNSSCLFPCCVCLHRGISVRPPTKLSYWLEFFCAALQVLSCWPVILLQALGISFWINDGTSIKHHQQWDGLRFPSPGICSLKPSSPASQTSNWTCCSFSLSDGHHQSPVDHVSQSYSHGLSNQTPGCGTSPVSICRFARFDWRFQIPSLWLGGLINV